MQRSRDVGRIVVDGQRGATIGIGHQLIRIDDEQPVGASDQLLHTARSWSRTDLDDEIGVVALPEVRIGGEQRPRRECAAPTRVAKSRKWLGEQRPASFGARFDQPGRRDPQTPRDHRHPVAGAHLAEEGGHARCG